eukprot:CAMPEP_0185691288 /NCGR_PEP_ID=MMETSP1164-20130828/1724_1 /TAXON_ID=1104430 /ORGANISM="Chrysoreinhardia sp, Strain CCMP2950" /LENGTH=39 /DNA_ID= /DNA_START= /DNA_END= /DNA_ORIENTATION=
MSAIGEEEEEEEDHPDDKARHDKPTHHRSTSATVRMPSS